jgi:hypothetical protein
MRPGPILAAALGVLLLCAPAWSSEPIAYVTEIQRKGDGSASVKRVDDREARPLQPLLVLRRGDEIRISGNVRVVLLYHAGAGTRTVDRSNSPFIVQPPTVARTNDRFQVLLATVGQVFLDQQSTPVYRRLAVRSVEPAAAIPVPVSPRSTRILPGKVTFEWTGGDQPHYVVRLMSPQGVIWEVADVGGRELVYPPEAPPLIEGVRYIWEVQAAGQPTQRADFEVLSNRDAKRIAESLRTLQSAAREGYSAGTVPLMRAAVLVDEGLYVDARRELQTVIAASPGEPAYHLLLGYIYDRIGLRRLAVESFERAFSLSASEAATGR